ncbi:MAG: 50S ribosomal protein L25 [Deltaproteobacteria bacterium]|jgi:large subunit ribosomal protein L25|nr:50S ribosomal protein L25 [Deltaproteobacteria bacterium]
METVDLSCDKREIRPKGLVNRIRREGRVPAVIYGNHGSAVAIAVGGAELKARVSTASRQRIMRLKSDSAELNDKHVILKDIQKTPVSGNILHADFYEVDLTKPLRVPVQFRFVGRAAGIADGGILSPLERQVEIECLPLEIPEAIEVDVTALKVHDVLHISTIEFPPNLRPIFDTDYPVITVMPPTVSEVATPVAAVEGATPAAGAEGATPAAGDKAGGAKPAAGAKVAPGAKAAAGAKDGGKKG